MFSLHFSSLLVTKRRKGRSDKGRQAKACGSELRTTETDAGVLVQYVEEVDEYVEGSRECNVVRTDHSADAVEW